jgi:hypothetical protein
MQHPEMPAYDDLAGRLRGVEGLEAKVEGFATDAEDRAARLANTPVH